jgi:imidazolonepropionase-like amidohydrolase
MKRIYVLIVISIFLAISVTGQQTPAPVQSKAFSIEGATAHLGNGQVIENSLIMFENGKIDFVGSALHKIARKGEIIQAKGKHVYPSFIVANSSLGLAEIDAVKATVDVDEIGQFLPHVRSIIAYNAESKVVESMRPNGILMGQIVPRGGVISGSSSIVQFDAWNWEDATVKGDDGIHINWPTGFSTRNRFTGGNPGPNKNYNEQVGAIQSFFDEGMAYLKSDRSPKNLPFEALEGLFNGSKQFYIHASSVKEITDGITFSKKMGIQKIVIVHGNDAHKVADLLVSNNIPVIVERAHRRPAREDDDYDLPYRTAAMLTEAGITVAVGMEGQMERMNARNLPFYAGTYAAYGMSKEDALKLITSNPARILGIADTVGTLEVGKHATLFISEGDALDMRGNLLTHAFIKGRKISLETYHTKMWKRYTKKYQNN